MHSATRVNVVALLPEKRNSFLALHATIYDKGKVFVNYLGKENDEKLKDKRNIFHIKTLAYHSSTNGNNENL